MREKYESLALADLKAIAKARGLKGTSAMKKADLVNLMLAEDEKDKAAARTAPSQASSAPSSQTQPSGQTSQSAGTAQPTAAAAAAGAAVSGGAASSAGTVPSVGTTQPAGQSQSEGQAAPQGAGSSYRSNRPYGERRSYSEGRTIKTRNYGENRYSSDSGNTGESRYTPDNRNTGESRYTPDNRNTGESRYTSDNRNTGESRYTSDNRNTGESRYSSENRNTAESRYSSETRNSGEERSENERSEEEKYPVELDSGIAAQGILEVMPDGYGFIRCENYLPGDKDVYVAPSQIRRFGLKTGDILEGNTRIRTQGEKFAALLFVKSINGYTPDEAAKRYNFEDMTPIFPNERLHLEMPGASVAMRIMDLISPVGKGQRGMIVSPPKAGKTTLLKAVAKSIKNNAPEVHLIILLIDERPEEVTDIKEAIEGPNVEVIHSTFDELPEHHKRVSEMVIERGKRLVEHKKDVMILIDSITRLTRAYNQTVPPSGRTLSGGLDPAALHMPKRFFGAARNMREGGSLTILATALVETGSKMDDVVYEEFKGTGNMELVLDRKLSERRVFPAIDIPKSSTRREDLLLSPDELEAINTIRRAFNGLKSDEAVEKVLDLFAKTRNNAEFVNMVKKMKWF